MPGLPGPAVCILTVSIHPFICQPVHDPVLCLPRVHQGNQELLEFRAASELLVESVCQEPPDPVEKPAPRFVLS